MSVDAKPRTGPARALSWQPPAGGFWRGSWRNSQASLAVHDPEDNSMLGYVSDASAADVDGAVVAVARSVGEDWPAWRRREALHAAESLLLQRRDLLIEVIYRESSKTIREATAEVSRAAETLRLSGEQAGQLTGETLPFADTPRGTHRLGWYSREPVGVVAAITPFNDPLNLVAHKMGPALVAGNGVVLKPAERTPLTALAFAEILLDAGVPAQRFAVLPGSGRTAGQALVSHPLVDLVSFTGGYSTGNAVARAAGARKTLMELGGNNATIVLADADSAAATRAVVSGAFGVAGQNCLSVQRVYVAAALADEFLHRVTTATRALRVGSKADAATDVGPLIDVTEAMRVERWVRDAVAGGATVHVGGLRDGAFYQPTVLTGVPTGARVLTDEVFGPVLTIQPVASASEAVALANGTEYGLQAGVFTRDLDTALNVARQLRVGAVLINDSSDFRIDAMPFGGPRRSGVGREGVRYAVEAMTEPKIVAIRQQPQATMPLS